MNLALIDEDSGSRSEARVFYWWLVKAWLLLLSSHSNHSKASLSYIQATFRASHWAKRNSCSMFQLIQQVIWQNQRWRVCCSHRFWNTPRRYSFSVRQLMWVDRSASRVSVFRKQVLMLCVVVMTLPPSDPFFYVPHPLFTP